MECMELIRSCAQDRENAGHWTEFLIRYSAGVRQFIGKARTLWHVRTCRSSCEIFGGEDGSDLFQAVIVRLVENDCALMRRFSGRTEEEWLAYLASMSYATVRKSVRRQGRLKRRAHNDYLRSANYRDPERRILAMEIIALCERITSNLHARQSSRDRLLFLLYFVDDLSLSQIAKCEGLSKSAVQEAISRLINRIRRTVQHESGQGRQLHKACLDLGYGGNRD